MDGTPIKRDTCELSRLFQFQMNLRDQVENQAGGMLGLLADGAPVYGPSMADDLDEKGGHFGQTFDFREAVYHIHLKMDGSPCARH